MTALSEEERQRYGRQLILPALGETGQVALKQSRVAVVGAGGLGCASLPYLAAVGVGHITIIDDDSVALSNLHRQLLYEDADIGRRKASCAKDRLHELNPHCTITAYHERLCDHNMHSLLAGHDIIIDGSDNFDTRFLINAVSIERRIPWVMAAARGFDAQYAIFAPYTPYNSACYRCFMPQHPGMRINECAERGVMGSIVAIAGINQAQYAINYLLDVNMDFAVLHRFNGITMQYGRSIITKDATCPHCNA